MDTNIIKEELKYVFGDKLHDFLGEKLKNCSDEYLKKKFNEYAEQNSKKIKIKDLIDNYQNESFLLNTPDGFNEVGDFYIKEDRNIYDIITEDNFYTKCSNDHQFETRDGWKYAENISKQDFILTKEGFKKVNTIDVLPDKEPVYDFEVLHNNHRYWSGNGLSSHNTAKTFVSLSVCREAQKKGYNIIYFDTEAGLDIDFVKNLGVDTSKFRLQPVNTIEQFNHIASKLVHSYKEMEKNGDTPPKTLIVLDSLGNLSSSKESEDSVQGSDKRDMTKQQQIRKLFRVNGLEFAKLGIPLIICNHVYASISSFFPTNEVSGGGGVKYNASTIFEFSKKKMDDKEGEKRAKEQNVKATKVGVTIKVKAMKNRFARPIEVQFHIPFYKKPNPYVGLEQFVSWDACGILRGKLLNEKDYNKLSENDKKKCKAFEITEEKNVKEKDPSTNKKTTKKSKEKKTVYAFPKDTARTIVCKHLGDEVPIKDLFTSKVFTQEVLEQLNENVIKPTFKMPDQTSDDDINEIDKEILDENED
ncbi:MAG: hypothetical protein ACOC1O_01505 [bacterium]